MRKLLVLLALAGASPACHQQAKTTSVATSSTWPVVQVEEVALPEPGLTEFFAPADTLTPYMRVWLATNDLSNLWGGNEYRSGNKHPMDGFLGPEQYRFSMVFHALRRDEQHPEVYWVRGKCRYRKFIRPFVGRLMVRQVINTPPSSKPLKGNQLSLDTVAQKGLTVRARFQLQEKLSGDSGLLEGEALVDFYKEKEGHRFRYAGHMDVSSYLPTRGGRVLVRGKRRNPVTGETRDFVVSPLVLAAAPDVFADFVVGDRSDEINPKYAHLGWNKYWENREWWYESGVPEFYF